LLGEPDGCDPAWLAALETGMAEHGAAVAIARERVVELLASRLADQRDGPFARATITLARWRPEKDAPEAALGEALRRSRNADAGAGRALVGPHRSDLAVTHAANGQPAEQCSTGEQKALLLAIVLAHAELVAERVERTPILLLDEVAAHLDPHRRAALFERLATGGGQVWVTGTERSLFDGVDGTATWLQVADGRVRAG
jgi:DNA replication and repair protein RecF